jgi:hypothetical protein
MANTGKQSPLGVNVLGSLLQNIGFYINPTAQSYMGINKSTQGSYSPGKIVNDTCLKWLTYAINDAYTRGYASGTDITVTKDTYNDLVTIGQSRIPALGNSPPPTWETSDPGGVWVNQHPDFYTNNQAGSPANSGYGFHSWTASYQSYQENETLNREQAYKNEGQLASWYPFLATASGDDVPNVGITQWGWIRCMALQAWNEFNWNGETIDQADNTPAGSPAYQFFVDTFSSCDSFKNYSNEAIFAINDSQDFLRGTFSNQDDLISADLAGVSLSSRAFGQDLINLGNGIDFNYIKTFGLPSSLLQILKKYNALTQPVILALLASGLSQNEIEAISVGNITPTKEQEQKIYGAFLVVVSTDLQEIQVILNCKTKGLSSLADLLSVKKMFPLSYTTLTVPIYNTAPGPTNSKTYYLLFIKQELNPQLVLPRIKEIVQVIVPPLPPPVVVEPPPAPPPPEPPKIPEPEVIIIPQPPSIPAEDPIPLPFVTGRDPAPGGIRGSGCPAPWMRILLSDGTYIPAGQLQKGMYVKTKHEHTLEEGNYRVSSVTIELQPRVEIIFDHVNFVCSTTHKFYHNNDWLEAQDVKYGDVISGKQVKEVKALPVDEVVRITVEDAHTYICEELFSHNKYTTGGGGGCVALESFVPLVEIEQKHNGREITKAWMLEAGMKISLGTDDLQIVNGKVVKTLNDYQPCVRISTADGITLVCSTTAPILTKDSGFIPATEVYGKRVAVMRNGRTWYDEVVQLEDVGMKFVRVIDAGNNSFWAGERPGAFILHHNVPINEQNEMEKK